MKKTVKSKKSDKLTKASSKPVFHVPEKGEPQTMAALLDLYSQKVYTPRLKEKVSGKVIKIEPGRLYVDINAKTEGLVAEKAYKEAENFIKTLKVGDRVDAFVIVTETREGYTVLSLRNSVESEMWDKIAESYQEEKPIKVTGKVVTGAGVMVEVGTISGFIPTSQLGRETQKNLGDLVGRSFMAVVIDFDKTNRKIVLSEKEVSEKEELKAARDAKKAIKVGEVFDGEVTTIYDFGCFVKILFKKVPLEGLVHVSEISWDKVMSPGSVVKIGQKVKVKVLGKKDNKLAFSMKQTQGDPWDKVSEKYKLETQVEGTVSRISDYGVFVTLSPGIEGLIHITKIPPDKKLTKGEKVTVNIEEIDKANKKISLGLLLTAKPIGYK